jgi:hypothetical protein
MNDDKLKFGNKMLLSSHGDCLNADIYIYIYIYEGNVFIKYNFFKKENTGLV